MCSLHLLKRHFKDRTFHRQDISWTDHDISWTSGHFIDKEIFYRLGKLFFKGILFNKSYTIVSTKI